MIRSFFKLTVRNLFTKNRLSTFVNIIGLAVGFGCLILVVLFIHDEYGFDRYHKNATRIYRIVLDFTSDGTVTHWAKTSAPIGYNLHGAYPDVEQVVRLRKNPGTDLLTFDKTQFYEERLYFADSTIFNVFDFKLKRGEPSNALTNRNSIIISEKLVDKYFHDVDPIGKILRFNSQVDLMITGILEEIPANSHFVSDAFISFSTLDELLGQNRLTHWGQFDHYTYILLAKGASPTQMESKFPDLLRKNAPEWVSEKETLLLQPLTSIHLHSDRKDEIMPNSRERYSFILGTIGILILLMVWANFINLSTASQISRSREIALQKILGARIAHLILYFFIEYLVVCIIALISGFILVYFALPYLNSTTGKQISFSSSGWLLMPGLIFTIVIVLFSSILPTMQTVKSNVLKISKNVNSSKSRSEIRFALITFQFSVSIFLIIATLIVSSQLKYLDTLRLGFESNHIVTIPIKDRSQNGRHSVLVDELSELQGVEKVSFSSSMPGTNNSLTYTYSFDGTGNRDLAMATFIIDENFLDLYNIKLKEGRSVRLNKGDTLADILINEAAVKQLRLSQPIGQLVSGKVKGRIVGIIENFNHTSLHSDVDPVILYPFTPTFRFVSAKLNEREIEKSILSIEKQWSKFYQNYPLEYSFLDDQIQQLYRADYQLRVVFTSFAIISIIIAGIGLVGLSSFLMSSKLKEISVRKVFGSSTTQLIQLIYLHYTKTILYGVLISWSCGYYLMSLWLDGFAYKTDLNLFDFVAPSLVMIFILFLTTGIQTINAAWANPIRNLRDE